jgi:predicted MFS family arabinose efflux permease
VTTALGIGEILGYGTTLYLPAVLARPIASDTAWPLPWIVAGLTIGSLTAGVIAHRVGHAIHIRGGRPVMIAGTLLLSVGLIGLGLAPTLPLHLLAWVVIGAGMAGSLYDAAFATLGTLYGAEARKAITAVTLFGGFASTICWPLGAFFVEWLGWRGTCFAFAVLHLGVTFPFYWFVLPHGSDRRAPDASRAQAPGMGVATKMEPSREWLLFGLMATVFSLGWGISSILSVHLLAIMQARGLELASAVALGALVGPSQVGGRLFEMILGKRYRSIHTLLISVVLVAAGLALLAAGQATVAAGLVAYGAGIGIASIARGTLPLSIFGPENYAIWVGRLAGPALVAGAVAPVLGAFLLDGAGPSITLYVLVGLALANIGIALVLWLVQGRGDVRHLPPSA